MRDTTFRFTKTVSVNDRRGVVSDFDRLHDLHTGIVEALDALSELAPRSTGQLRTSVRIDGWRAVVDVSGAYA